MIKHPVRRIAVVMLATCWVVVSQQDGFAQAEILAPSGSSGAESEAGDLVLSQSELERDILDLGSRSHATRERARLGLIRHGEAARDALISGTTHPDIEIRSSCRYLLDLLAETRQERLLRQLLHTEATNIDLPCWARFASIAGDGPEARRLFAAMLREQPGAMDWLHELASASGGEQSAELLSVDDHLPLDFTNLHDGDPVRWGVLLLAAQMPQLEILPVLSSRIRNGLLNPTVSQRLRHCQYAETLQRLLSHWLATAGEHYVNASMLKLGLVYRCEATAVELATRTLASRQASPTSIATALMLLARLRPEAARVELKRWVDDARVCHVWQVMASKRRAVQTQIGDVATALLLHLTHHDPRDFGFLDLEADPDTIFREFSMGFEDEKARQAAYTEAHTLLGLLAK